MKPIILGDKMHEDSEKGYAYIPQFYLHGEAEHLNGYDIASGNIECFQRILRCHLFTIDLKLQDGKVYDGLVIPYISGERRIEGLICLCMDTDGIRHAMFDYHKSYGDKHIDTCMDDTSKSELYQKYPEIQTVIRNYNRSHD